MFRGYKQYDYESPLLNEVIEHYTSLSIESYNDWMLFIEGNNWPIVNEYGETLTIEEFKEVITRNTTDNQIEWVRKNGPEFLKDYWYDKYGYCFYGKYFS